MNKYKEFKREKRAYKLTKDIHTNHYRSGITGMLSPFDENLTFYRVQKEIMKLHKKARNRLELDRRNSF